MKDIETSELETDNVFLSLIQDFGKKRSKDTWITVSTVLRTYGKLRLAQPPLKRLPLDTQFIVILKGIGLNTYQCLKDKLQAHGSTSPNWLQRRTRTYLQELRNARVDYVDKNEEKRIIAMQSMPLVYGESMLGSEEWMKYRSEEEDRRREDHGEADESMDEVELC
jgi:hypothetical protein